MSSKQYIVMLDRAAGNESVGEMWTETKIFPESATLAEVAAWVYEKAQPHDPDGPIRSNVRIATAQ